MTIALFRDNQAVDLEKEGFVAGWVSDRATGPVGLAGIEMDRRGTEASAVIQREPGMFRIGWRVSRDEMKDPGFMSWSWTFRPDWKAHADEARFRFNLVSDGVPAKIKTTDGRAVAGAQVALIQDPSSGIPGIETSNFIALRVAGDDGTAHFRDIPEGRYTLRVTGAVDEDLWCLRAGDVRFLPPSDGSVELSTEGVVGYRAARVQELNRKLRVLVTEAGRPVAGQDVRVELDWYRVAGDDKSRTLYEVNGKTGEDGVAEAMLVDGWAQIHVPHVRMGLLEAYATVSGSSAPLELTCQIPREEDQAMLSGVVPGFSTLPRDVDGLAIVWIVFVDVHMDGDLRAGVPFRSKFSVRPDAEGRFGARAVLPGRYDVALRGSALGEATPESVKTMRELMYSHSRTVLVEIGKGESKEILLEESP